MHARGQRLLRDKSAADKAYHVQRRALRDLQMQAAAGAPPASTSALAAAEASMRACHQTRTAAGRSLRSHRRRLTAARITGLIKRLEETRVRDPSAFFKLADRITPADLSTLPNAPPAVPLAALVAHHSAGFKETRGPPPALTTGRWDAFIPRARPGTGDRLMRTVQWWEVYLLLFPADKQLLAYMTPCCDGCVLCTDFTTRLAVSEWGNPARPVPDWMPHLNTCRAGGEDGLIAELLCFTRPPSGKFEWRQRVATDLATVMDTWLREGVPAAHGFREVHVSAPAKPLRPGAPAPANPATNTRPISVSVIFAKVFELIISARAEHWRVAEGLVGPQQAAFMQFHSAEMQVLALRESVLWRRAQGLGTNVVFVDFRAAYDSVHHAMLWHVLRTMGFPEGLIAVLSGWYASRSGRIKSGGELSGAFPIDKGVTRRRAARCLRCCGTSSLSR
jgi:hypothetical protein